MSRLNINKLARICKNMHQVATKNGQCGQFCGKQCCVRVVAIMTHYQKQQELHKLVYNGSSAYIDPLGLHKKPIDHYVC